MRTSGWVMSVLSGAISFPRRFLANRRISATLSRVNILPSSRNEADLLWRQVSRNDADSKPAKIPVQNIFEKIQAYQPGKNKAQYLTGNRKSARSEPDGASHRRQPEIGENPQKNRGHQDSPLPRPPNS